MAERDKRWSPVTVLVVVTSSVTAVGGGGSWRLQSALCRVWVVARSALGGDEAGWASACGRALCTGREPSPSGLPDAPSPCAPRPSFLNRPSYGPHSDILGPRTC